MYSSMLYYIMFDTLFYNSILQLKLRHLSFVKHA